MPSESPETGCGVSSHSLTAERYIYGGDIFSETYIQTDGPTLSLEYLPFCNVFVH